MNAMMMMAMAMAVSHRSNATSTVQTILGASDNLGQTGRLAVGMIRQRSDEKDREASDRKLGREVVALLEQQRLDAKVLEKLPGLQRVVKLATPAPATAVAAGHTHGTQAAAVAQRGGSSGAHTHGLASLAPHAPVDEKYAMAVRAGNVAGLDRLARRAELAAQEATAEATVATNAAAAADAIAATDAAAAETAQKAVEKSPDKPELVEAAKVAKKKAAESAAAADAARSDAHRAEATAHAMRHAVKDLKARLAAEC